MKRQGRLSADKSKTGAAGRAIPTVNPTPKKGPKTQAKPESAPVDWRPVFLAALAESGNVSAAARKAHINRDTAYATKSTEDKQGAALIEAQAFARQWQDALEVATDALEFEARRRALKGVKEPVGWYQGKAGGTVQRYSDTLMIFLLKAHRPEKFGERIRQVHEGEIGVGVLTPEQIEARRAQRWQQIAPTLAAALATTDDESAADA